MNESLCNEPNLTKEMHRPTVKDAIRAHVELFRAARLEWCRAPQGSIDQDMAAFVQGKSYQFIQEMRKRGLRETYNMNAAAKSPEEVTKRRASMRLVGGQNA